MQLTLIVHITAGAIALLAGYVALFSPKGERVHRKSGMLFVYSMTVMAILGATIAAIGAGEGSVIAGLLTAYLVITALITVRPTAAAMRWPNVALMVMALTVGATAIVLGIRTLGMPGAKEDGIPAGMFFLFGTVALLSGVSDLRAIRSAGLQGAQRLRRHLWRMCFALWVAASSFFFGQADEFPPALRIPALLAIPVLIVVVMMVYWLVRVRVRRQLFAASER